MTPVLTVALEPNFPSSWHFLSSQCHHSETFRSSPDGADNSLSAPTQPTSGHLPVPLPGDIPRSPQPRCSDQGHTQSQTGCSTSSQYFLRQRAWQVLSLGSQRHPAQTQTRWFRRALSPPAAVPHTHGPRASLSAERQPRPPGSGRGRPLPLLQGTQDGGPAPPCPLPTPSAAFLSRLVLPSPTKVLGGSCHLSGTSCSSGGHRSRHMGLSCLS